MPACFTRSLAAALLGFIPLSAGAHTGPHPQFAQTQDLLEKHKSFLRKLAVAAGALFAVGIAGSAIASQSLNPAGA
jgi:hypothetical protein